MPSPRRRKIHLESAEENRRFDVYIENWMPTITPGLIITPGWITDRTIALKTVPVITHEHSGDVVCGPWESIDQAKKIAAALGSILSNWFLPRDQVRVIVERRARELDLWNWLQLLVKNPGGVL